MPTSLRTAVTAIVLAVVVPRAHAATDSPTSTHVLPPFAYAVFCVQYPFECRANPHKSAFRVTDARFKELEDVNELINTTIRPTARPADVRDRWLINPSSGTCHDYAVTKRHELLIRGWPSERLLLAEVIHPTTGEHHLVLLVRAHSATWVLDNLESNIHRVADIKYILLRVQSAGNPKLWTTAFNF